MEQPCRSASPESLDLHSAFERSSITNWKWYYRYGSRRSADKAFPPLAASWEPTDTAEVGVWQRRKKLGWLLERHFAFSTSPLTNIARPFSYLRTFVHSVGNLECIDLVTIYISHAKFCEHLIVLLLIWHSLILTLCRATILSLLNFHALFCY